MPGTLKCPRRYVRQGLSRLYNPLRSDKIKEFDRVLGKHLQLYNPLRSDKMRDDLIAEINLMPFITHYVQIKFISIVIIIVCGRCLYNPLRSDKIEMHLNCSEVVSDFITHYVQIKSMALLTISE